MSKDVAVRSSGEVSVVTWTNEQIDLIKRTIAVGSTGDELQLFMYQAKRTGLDPLSRQIHFVKRKGKGTIQTAIDGYRLIADRTGKYAGNDDYRFDEGLHQYQHMSSGRGNPMTATATVYKMVDGVRTAFSATAAWEEYFPGEVQGFMWEKMPYLMIGKCAEALALRKAFPAELSGIYTNEEMQQADADVHVGKVVPPSDTYNFNLGPCAPNYGKYAKQSLCDIPEDGLRDYLSGVRRSIDDPKKANFKAKNEQMAAAIEEELASREPVEPDGAESKDVSRKLPDRSSDSHQQSSDAAPPQERNLVLDLSVQINDALSQQLVNAVLQEAAKCQVEGKLTRQEFITVQKCADERRKQLRGK